MVISGIWQLSYQLDSTWHMWNTSTLIVIVSPNRKTFIGEVLIDDPSSRNLRCHISGFLCRKEIRWRYAGLEYRGKFFEEYGKLIHSGQVCYIGWSPACVGVCGTFYAVHMPAQAGRVKTTLQAGCRVDLSHMRTCCTITDDMLDTLDRKGASIEVLRTWQNHEVSAMEELMCTESLLMPPIRQILIRHMKHILTAAGASERWCNAVTLLDKCASYCVCHHFMEELPLTMMAVLHLVQSIDSATPYMPLNVYADHAWSVAHWLHSLGYIAEAPTRITSQQIQEHATSLLDKLHGVLLLPAARDWLLVLFTRLEVLTQNQYATHLTCARSRCDAFVKMCTLILDATDPHFPPSRIACGLLVHSLVAVGLLPVHILQPACFDCIDWQTLFAAGQLEGSEATFPCMLDMEDSAIFVAQVQASVGANLALIIEDSIHMAIFMRDAFHSLRTWDKACQPCPVRYVLNLDFWIKPQRYLLLCKKKTNN